MRVARILAPALALALASCGGGGRSDPAAPDERTETRAPCADRSALRKLYFGDLHVHTARSHETWLLGVRATAAGAFRFARGEPLAIPPLEGPGAGRVQRLDRPLDFAAVTDHGEFLGEVEACLSPGSGAYESPTCRVYRQSTDLSEILVAFPTFTADPRRNADICGPGRADCAALAGSVWREIQEEAEAAYDRGPDCRFSSFVAYEHTGIPGASNRHRNVIFRNGVVPPLPISYFEEPTPEGLWRALEEGCTAAGEGCDVLAIPHNTNESNGGQFLPLDRSGATLEEQRELARQRAAVEPLVEVFQHKGDSECLNGVSGVRAEPDPLCDFEKLRRAPFDDCGDGTGVGGVLGLGCISRRDYVRNVLVEGLAEEERLGVNPFKAGLIASSDTHNATPGATEEDRYLGHWGVKEATPEQRLAEGELTTLGLRTNPGGLTAVWAVENSRDGIFEAFRRRETYATSGTRISVRLFGGWELDPELCADPRLVERADAAGVPMGADLPPRPDGAGAPRIVVAAAREPDLAHRPGTRLERIEIVKGWLDTDASPPERAVRVHLVAGAPVADPGVDLETCTPSGAGSDTLCTVWSDPDFRADQRAVYYARVVESPSCRWSTRECNALPSDERPAACDDPELPRTVRERAWTSPLWYAPGR